MLSRLFQQHLLNGFHHGQAIAREELHRFFRGFVAAQQAILLVVAAAVHASAQNIIQAIDPFRARGAQKALGALARMNVAGQNIGRIGQNRAAIVCQHNFHLAAGAFNQFAVVRYVIHARERMLAMAKKRVEFRFCEHFRIRIDARRVQRIQTHQMVAHFIGRIAHQDINLLKRLGNAF